MHSSPTYTQPPPPPATSGPAVRGGEKCSALPSSTHSNKFNFKDFAPQAGPQRRQRSTSLHGAIGNNACKHSIERLRCSRKPSRDYQTSQMRGSPQTANATSRSRCLTRVAATLPSTRSHESDLDFFPADGRGTCRAGGRRFVTGMALAARTDAPLPRGFARLSGRRSNHGAARGNSRRAAPTAVTLTSTRHTGPKFAARRPARAANLGRERDRAPDSFRWRGPAFLKEALRENAIFELPEQPFRTIRKAIFGSTLKRGADS